MFGMMTPIDAISYGLKAGMVFGQAQTIWATRLMEMQGFWMGYPGTVSDLPKSVPSSAATPSPVVTELHVEAMAATPTAAVIPAPKPVAATATAQPRPVAKAKPRSGPATHKPVAAVAPLAKPVLIETSADTATMTPPLLPEPVTETAPAPIADIAPELPAAMPAADLGPEAASAETAVFEDTAPPPVAAFQPDLALKPIPRRALPTAKDAPKPPFAE